MMYILAIIGGVWLCFAIFTLVLRALFGSTPEQPVIIVTHRVEDDSTKDRRNLGGGLGL